METVMANRLRAGVATLALTVALTIGATASSTSAFAGGECGAGLEKDVGDLNYDGTPAPGNGPRMSIKKITQEQYGYSFWVENKGKDVDDPSAKFIVHAGNGKKYTFPGWCQEAKPNADGELFVNVYNNTQAWVFPILSNQLGALRRISYSR